MTGVSEEFNFLGSIRFIRFVISIFNYVSKIGIFVIQHAIKLYETVVKDTDEINRVGEKEKGTARCPFSLKFILD